MNNAIPCENNNQASTIWLFHQPMKKSCQPCNHNFDKLPENKVIMVVNEEKKKEKKKKRKEKTIGLKYEYLSCYHQSELKTNTC